MQRFAKECIMKITIRSENGMNKVDYMLRIHEIVGNGFIDMEATGKKLKKLIFEKGYTVRGIQNYLGLNGPNSIYRWFKGKALPSTDHLYELSKLFRVHMEDLLVPYGTQVDFECALEIKENRNAENRWRRMIAYYELMNKCVLD